ncbi:Peptidyl-prolyl cis-trans isomerase CYP22 [Sesamum angolense]|uniref:peptidylprolyl isomerase n=1 Tax=Sesamum angolense TaxID=2727404 RepID=A0AAE1X7S7_9LAMI|nr:Peptidyl-prolyl cis-trans isomerase CYP22 [Sesamum angolense]
MGSYDLIGFNFAMYKVKELKPNAYDWLVKIQAERWSKHVFDPRLKNDHVPNNIRFGISEEFLVDMLALGKTYMRDHLENFTNNMFTKERYVGASSYPRSFIWPQDVDVNPTNLKPPVSKRLPGRPKKSRRKEPKETTVVKRSNLIRLLEIKERPPEPEVPTFPKIIYAFGMGMELKNNNHMPLLALNTKAAAEPLDAMAEMYGFSSCPILCRRRMLLIYVKQSVFNQFLGSYLGIRIVVPVPSSCSKQFCTGEYRKAGLPVGYKGCQFHRVIKDFMIQAGDFLKPTISPDVYLIGRVMAVDVCPFMEANSGPNSNGCQFFITCAKCDWLDNKHVVFGRVLGDGLLIVRKIENVATGPNNRPKLACVIAECGEM